LKQLANEPAHSTFERLIEWNGVAKGQRQTIAHQISRCGGHFKIGVMRASSWPITTSALDGGGCRPAASGSSELQCN
jgi:hypothetical protein